jgi:hypothetical protein
MRKGETIHAFKDEYFYYPRSILSGAFESLVEEDKHKRWFVKLVYGQFLY